MWIGVTECSGRFRYWGLGLFRDVYGLGFRIVQGSLGIGVEGCPGMLRDWGLGLLKDDTELGLRVWGLPRADEREGH